VIAIGIHELGTKISGAFHCIVKLATLRVTVLLRLACDRFWYIAEGLNVYKVALDTREHRIISHTTATGTTTIPPTEITCGVIQISNLDFSDPTKFKKDIKPVLNRSLLVGLTFDDLACYEYTCGLIMEGMLRRPIKLPGQTDYILSRAAVNEILKLFCDNANRFSSLSPRTLAQIIAPLRAGSDYDRWVADVEGLMRTPAQMAANPRVFKNAAGEIITKLHCYQLPEGKKTQRPPPPKGPNPPITVMVTERPPGPPITIPVTLAEDSGRGGYEAVDETITLLHPDLSGSAMDAAVASTHTEVEINDNVAKLVPERIAEVKERIEAGRAARLAAIEDTPWWQSVTADGLVDRHVARVREGSPPMTVVQHLALDGITDPEWRDRFEGQITRGLAPAKPMHATSKGTIIPAKPAGRFHHLIGIVYLPKPPGKRGRPSKERP
jgi:hypothetical protein